MSDPWAFGWTQVLTIVGMLLTIGFGIAGFRTFGKWKREKIEERRIDVAIEALAIAYEGTIVFEGIRSRRVREFEYDDIDSDSGDVTYPTARMSEELRRTLGSPYAVLKRMDRYSDFFERAAKIEPKYMAVFGTGSGDEFALLFKAKAHLQSAAEALLDDLRIELDPQDTKGRERRRKLRVELFLSPGQISEGDDVGKILKEFRSKVEARCRPIIDRSFRNPRQRTC